MRRCGILSLLLTLMLAAAAQAVLVRIESDPEGFDAWADERYIGRTPTETILPPGRVKLRLALPSESLFVAPVADTILTVPEAETLRVVIGTARTVSVRSRPFDLPLFHDGRQIGRTPLDFPLDARRPGRLDLLTPAGRVAVPTDSLLAKGSWSWMGGAGVSEGVAGGQQSMLRRLGRYALPGLAVGLAASGILVKDEADRSYDQYLKTADPEEIRRLFDESEGLDVVATVLWTAAEVCVVTSIIAWILPEHAPRRPGEEQR